MFFLTLVALVLLTLSWDAARKVAQRREEERVARAAYYQNQLDYQRILRDEQDARARMVRSAKRLGAGAEAKRLAAAERRERYY